MIKLKLVEQSKNYTCGPAVLKMILSYYGINKSESLLEKETKTSNKHGCQESAIVKVAKNFGLKGYVKQKSSISELRRLNKKGIPVIIDWFSPDVNSHYSIVVGFKGDKIMIADPSFGKIRTFGIKWFEERWFDMFNMKKPLIKEIIVIEK